MSALPDTPVIGFQFSTLARKTQQLATNQALQSFDEAVSLLTNPKVLASVKEDLPLFFPGLLDPTKAHAGQQISNYCMVVGDYDSEVVDIEEASAQLQALGVKALIIPTNRWTPTTPRWRVVAPLSRPVQDATTYSELVDRLNACLQGVLASESWNQKFGWFYGALQGRVYARHVLIEGRCIDEAAEIQGLKRPESVVDTGTASAAANKLATFDAPPGASSIALIGSALAAIKDTDYQTWIDVTFALKSVEQHQISMRAIWADWTQKHPKFKEVDLKKWDSVHPQYAHWGKVFDIAKKYGWVGDDPNLAQDAQEYLGKRGADFENRYWAKYAAPLDEGGRNDMLLWRVKRCEKGSQALKRELGEYITAYTMAKRQYGLTSRVHMRLEYQEDVTNTANQTAAIVQAIRPRLAGFELVYFAEQLSAIRCVEEPDTKSTTATARPRKHLIRRHSKSSLTAVLEQHIVFSARREDSGMPYPKAIPQSVLDHCLTGHDVLVPRLNGLVNHPVVLADGRIVSDHGYDAETKLFNTAPSISYRPCSSLDEARDWLKELQAMPILCDIAYATKLDQAAGLSALLNQMNRKAFDKAPGSMFTAPTAGSGKTTAVCSYVEAITGFEAVTRAWPFDNNEMNKTLLAIGRSGVSQMIFDNLGDGVVFRADALDGYMTTSRWAARLLGESTDIEVPATASVYITGNNIRPGGALATRLLPININTKLVNPTKRTYTHPDTDRFTTIIKYRPRILEICTGLLAWSASQPYESGGRNRFPMWDRSIGHAIRLLMDIDVSEAFDQQFATATSTEEAQQLIRALLPLCESCRLQGLDPFISLRELTSLINTRSLPESSSRNGRNGKAFTFEAAHLNDLQMCYEEARIKSSILHSKTVGAPLARIKDVLIELDGKRKATLLVDERKGGFRWFQATYVD